MYKYINKNVYKYKHLHKYIKLVTLSSECKNQVVFFWLFGCFMLL